MTLPEAPTDLAAVEAQQAKYSQITHEKWESVIREWAYRKWEEAGRPHGRSEEFWLAAKAELSQARHFALLTLKALYWQYKYEDLAQSVFELGNKVFR